MKLEDASNMIFNQFAKPISQTKVSDAHIEVVWIIENKSEYDFEHYSLRLLTTDENDVVLDDKLIWIENLLSGMKKEISHYISSRAVSMSVKSDDDSYEIKEKNYELTEKEECIKEIYKMGVLSRREYDDICNYISAGAIDINEELNCNLTDEYVYEWDNGVVENSKFLELNKMEKKIKAIHYLNSKQIIEEKELIDIIDYLSGNKHLENVREETLLKEQEEVTCKENEAENGEVLGYTIVGHTNILFEYGVENAMYDQKKIQDIDLELETKCCLDRAGIKSLHDLMNYSFLELRKFEGMNNRLINDVIRYANRYEIAMKHSNETLLIDCYFSEELLSCMKKLKKNTVGDLKRMNSAEAKKLIKMCKTAKIHLEDYFMEFETIGLGYTLINYIYNELHSKK